MERLPAAVREFAEYLSALVGRLDQGGGWCGVFWRRDPDGMQACLEGREEPPWDVVEALLQDLAALHGQPYAVQEAARARELHTASLAAYDALPGARHRLGDRLDVMLREQRHAAGRRAELARRLPAAPPDEAATIERDLAWAQDDHARASARCTELQARLAEIDQRTAAGAGEPRGTRPDPSARRSGFDPDAGYAGYGHDDTGQGGLDPAATGHAGFDHGDAGQADFDPLGSGRADHDPLASGHADYDHADPMRTGFDPVAGQGDHDWTAPGQRDHDPAALGAPGPGAPAAGYAAYPDAPASAYPEASEYPGPSEYPDASEYPAVSAYPEDPGYPGAEPDPSGGGRAARPRGGARFAGAADGTDGGEQPAVVFPGPTATPAAGAPRGARFAGSPGASSDDAQRTDSEGEGAREAVAGAVAALMRLRAEGRGGEAHAVLVEAASWPPDHFPLFAVELSQVGLDPDWSTLLWEASSQPTDRLVALADTLTAGGLAADGGRLLRQAVARPAPEVSAAALVLVEEGRDREVGALLDACVRSRPPEEAARCAQADPQRLVPLLTAAAEAVSETCHGDLLHALRVAGLSR